MDSSMLARSYGERRPVRLLLVRERTDGASQAGDDHAAAPSRQPADPAAASDWKQVHRQLLSLGRVGAAHDREVCRWLLAAQRLGVHVRIGYASLAELAERLLGLRGRETEERLRVGRALCELPLLDAAFASGKLVWSAVRELTRVATRQSEQAWLTWAKGRRVKEIEAAVVARASGDGPSDRADPARVQHRLSFAVRAETMALWRDLQSAVRKDFGGSVDDDTLLYEIARRALGGPSDEGRASYQVAVVRCDDCGRTHVDAGGASVPVDETIAAMAACDAQVLQAKPGTDGSGPALSEPASGPHVRDRRATQTIPPATRRAVTRRDHKRCVVPGCSNHRFLDLHHLDPRAEGGGHDPARLALVCGAHHRAVHSGAICIDGTASSGFVVRHGDGTAYGGHVGAGALDHARLALDALVHMGFKPTQARKLLDDALRTGTGNDRESLLRAALRAS